MSLRGEEVKVLGQWPSPFVMRVRIALNIKGVEYEFLEETNMVDKSELLLKSNPVYKKIPVLIHNGKPICESMIIVQYIDDVWSSSGPAIIPADPYERAIARFWAVYIDDKLFSAMGGLFMAPNEEAKVESLEKLSEGLQLLEGAFEKCSKGNGFFGGETIGYLDIAFGGIMAWLRVLETLSGVGLVHKGKTPLLEGWADRFSSDPAVKEVMPENDKLVEFGKMLFAKAKASAPPA